MFLVYNIALKLIHFMHSSLYLLVADPYPVPPPTSLFSVSLSPFLFVIFTSLFYFLESMCK